MVFWRAGKHVFPHPHFESILRRSAKRCSESHLVRARVLRSQAGAAKAGQEDRPMHAVIRTYSGQGAKELFDLLEQRKSDVERLIRSVKGFVSYSLVRTSDGGLTMTVCED